MPTRSKRNAYITLAQLVLCVMAASVFMYGWTQGCSDIKLGVNYDRLPVLEGTGLILLSTFVAVFLVWLIWLINTCKSSIITSY